MEIQCVIKAANVMIYGIPKDQFIGHIWWYTLYELHIFSSKCIIFNVMITFLLSMEKLANMEVTGCQTWLRKH